MSAVRRVRWSAAVVVLGLSAALSPVPAVGLPSAARHHHHAPTAAQLARGQREVARREREVKVAAAAIGRAQANLRQLNVAAEVAFEAYDGAKVKLQTAQRAVNTAHLVLHTANTQVTKGQAQVTSFATAAYESDGLSTLSAYLEPGGPSKLVSRVGALDAISSSEHSTLQSLDAARIYQAVVSRQAEGIQAKASAAAVVASRAKAAAATAVSHQNKVLAGLQQQESQLRTLLSQAQSNATRLQRAHLAALARARARAAARAATPPAPPASPRPFSGSTGSTAGTVSAATAAAALQAAESQIGKPYQWGAAGPNTYDCSGLVLWAYAQEGVTLDHWTGDQWKEGAHVSQSQLRPGDLVFFATNTSDPATIHHVGMYVGNGQMVDAPFTGAFVRYDAAFRSDYIGAVRPYQR